MNKNSMLILIGALTVISTPAYARPEKKMSIEQIDAAIEAAKTNPKTSPEFRELLSLPYVKGPAKVPITENAQITLGNDKQFLDSASSKRFLELNGNLSDGPDEYIVMPRDESWWSSYSYNDMGHVKDGDKLDADDLLSKIKASQEAANLERQKRGLSALTVQGWQVPPHYDNTTKQLEWGLDLKDEKTGERFVNYTTRILGREGLMAATLIARPERFDTSLAEFRASVSGFRYNPDKSYQSFRQGDRVAEYGLAALVVGGVTAAAVKSGAAKGLFAGALLLLKGFGKAIIVAVGAICLAMISKIKSLFGKGPS